MVCFFFYLCSSKRNRKFKHLAPVVRQADNAIHWIAQLVSLTVIRWIVIYPVDSVIQLFDDINRNFNSRTLFVEVERFLVALFKSFVERRPLLKHPCDRLFCCCCCCCCFSFTSVANETENLNIWFKLNQWVKIS